MEVIRGAVGEQAGTVLLGEEVPKLPWNAIHTDFKVFVTVSSDVLVI